MGSAISNFVKTATSVGTSVTNRSTSSSQNKTSTTATSKTSTPSKSSTTPSKSTSSSTSKTTSPSKSVGSALSNLVKTATSVSTSVTKGSTSSSKNKSSTTTTSKTTTPFKSSTTPSKSTSSTASKTVPTKPASSSPAKSIANTVSNLAKTVVTLSNTVSNKTSSSTYKSNSSTTGKSSTSSSSSHTTAKNVADTVNNVVKAITSVTGTGSSKPSTSSKQSPTTSSAKVSPTPTKAATSTGGNTARTAVTLGNTVSNKATTTPKYKANSNNTTDSHKSGSTFDNLGNAVKNLVSGAASATGQKPSNSTTNRSTPSASANNRNGSLPSNKNNSTTINRGIVSTAGNMGKAAAALINYGYSNSSINPKTNSRINITSPSSATASVGNLANKISSAIRIGSNKTPTLKAMKSPIRLPGLSNLSTPRATKTFKPVGDSLKGVSSLNQKNKSSWPTKPDGFPIINSPEDAKLYYQSLWPKRADGSPIINSEEDAKLYNDPIGTRSGKNNNSKPSIKANTGGTTNKKNSLDSYGINLNEIKMNNNSTVKNPVVTDAQVYTKVPNDSLNAGKPGYITEYEYNLLIAQVAHEAGSVSQTNCYGVASALVNLSENQYNGDFTKCINDSCVRFENERDALYSNYISKEDGTLLKDTRGSQISTAKGAVDVVLSGTRAFPSEVQFWVGNGKYNKFSTTYKESADY